MPRQNRIELGGLESHKTEGLSFVEREDWERPWQRRTETAGAQGRSWRKMLSDRVNWHSREKIRKNTQVESVYIRRLLMGSQMR